MICPQCEAAGERSRVFPGETEVTLMEWTEHWDEDGVYVSDDPNTRTHNYFRAPTGTTGVRSRCAAKRPLKT